MNESLDHCKLDPDGNPYAGDHLLVELWGGVKLDDPDYLRDTMEAGARAAGATILHSHYHPFGEGQGVSGVTILAESHITVHTWPELGYAAIDIFMCGACDPKDCLPVLEEFLQPDEMISNCVIRGQQLRARRAQRVA